MMKINAEMVVNAWIVLPEEDEQRELLRHVNALKQTTLQFKYELDKYTQIRSGLMQDLLTGKVLVHADLAEEAVHA